jgi:hypothetical protein
LIPKISTSKISVAPGGNHLARPGVSIDQVGGDDQLALSAHLHDGHALILPFDDPARAKGESEEIGPVVEEAHVHDPGNGPEAPAVGRRLDGGGEVLERSASGSTAVRSSIITSKAGPPPSRLMT